MEHKSSLIHEIIIEYGHIHVKLIYARHEDN